MNLCHDALARNVEGFGVSPFLLFSLGSATVLPACLLLMLLQDRIGRKAMLCSSLLVSGMFTAATGICIAYEKKQTQSEQSA